MDQSKALTRSDVVVVFGMAKAGLGHLRVTRALYHGLPKEVEPLLLGVQDEGIVWLHRVLTVHPVIRSIGEWVQRGWPQDIFSYWYRDYLEHHTTMLYEQMLTILDQRLERPKTLLFVSTHFGLGHQMAAIKGRLEKERQVKVVLVIVVTDDTPQHLWAVPEADLIFVPSLRTKNALEAYHQRVKLKASTYVVAPYPVSPELAENLKKEELMEKVRQAQPDKTDKIRIVLPISGAAVHLDYYHKLISELTQRSDRYLFHVVSKQAKYTAKFLGKFMGKPNVILHVSGYDRDVVRLYEEVYRHEPILLEVTKPSEQAFKALIRPECIGGALLLFAKSVGRQEHDNVNFLRRHNLMPDKQLQRSIWRVANSNKTRHDLPDEAKKEIGGWRGIRLPEGGKESAVFIDWCLKQGVFSQMLEFRGYQNHPELASDGVKQVWGKVEEYLGELT